PNASGVCALTQRCYPWKGIDSSVYGLCGDNGSLPLGSPCNQDFRTECAEPGYCSHYDDVWTCRANCQHSGDCGSGSGCFSPETSFHQTATLNTCVPTCNPVTQSVCIQKGCGASRDIDGVYYGVCSYDRGIFCYGGSCDILPCGLGFFCLS